MSDMLLFISNMYIYLNVFTYLSVFVDLHPPECFCVSMFVCLLSDDNGENRMVRTRSLSKITSSVARQQYVDTSDEEEYQRYPQMYQQPPHRQRGSRTSSQENLGQAPPVRTINQSLEIKFWWHKHWIFFS